MQVFLPYPDFKQSVQCLDKSRLGNQIWRECKTIMNGGWSNHPASRMWSIHKHALAVYMWEGLLELRRRNEINIDAALRLKAYLIDIFPHPTKPNTLNTKYTPPPFIGVDSFHKSHRLNLLFKYPEWYAKFFPEPVPLTKPQYIWPTGLPYTQEQ